MKKKYWDGSGEERTLSCFHLRTFQHFTGFRKVGKVEYTFAKYIQTLIIPLGHAFGLDDAVLMAQIYSFSSWEWFIVMAKQFKSKQLTHLWHVSESGGWNPNKESQDKLER